MCAPLSICILLVYAVVSPNHSFSLVAHHAGWWGVGSSRKGLAALHIISFCASPFHSFGSYSCRNAHSFGGWDHIMCSN